MSVSYRVFFDGLTNEQVRQFLTTACKDLETAAQTEPNGDWHEACFAAVMLAADELQARALKEKF